MKAKLVIAFTVLLLASVVRADQVNVNGVEMIIPDGSAVTSVTTNETPSGDLTYNVDYSFADGTGSTEFELHSGDLSTNGEIYFTNPVSNVEFSYFGNPFLVGDNVGDGFFAPEESTSYSGTFAGPGITSIGWQGYSFVGGITSLSYTVDANVSEPSPLLLSGMGLAALIGFARRNRTKRPNAMA